MEKIKAFIGHSFLPNDEDVVKKFLDFFNHLKDLEIPFEWEHAKYAEPKLLSEKVINLMNDKNTFIGICTKKENVIAPEKLNKCFLTKNTKKCNGNDLASKTSDWIIQEIGIAFGKGMEIILLVEEGLRKPGGIQGNLEYIEFDRTTPEKSFTKITEMIRILLPKKSERNNTSTQIDDRLTSASNENVMNDKTELNEIVVTETMTEEEFEGSLITAIVQKNHNKIKETVEVFNKVYGNISPEKKNSFQAKKLYYENLLNDSNTFSEMQILLKEDPLNAEVLFCMAKLYQANNEFGKAKEYFQIAYDNTPVIKNKIRYLSQFIISLFKSGNSDYNEYLIQLLKLNHDNESREEILVALTEIFSISSEKYLHAITVESILQNYPLDNGNRFNLAYSYADTGNDDLAFLHYKFLVTNSADSVNWNNFGVQASRLKFKNKAIKAFQKASNEQNTLAMSNLAQEYQINGFIGEARSLCKQAMKIEDYHKNVTKVLTQIEEMIESERSNELKTIEEANLKRNVLVQLGDSILKPQLTNLTKKWIHPKCILDISINNNVFSATGKYNKGRSLLSTLIDYNTQQEHETNYKEDYEISLKGEIYGSLIKVDYFDSNLADEKDTILNIKEKLLLLLNDDLTMMSCYKISDYSHFMDLYVEEKE